MKRILLGLIALVALAFVVGAASHWFLGLSIALVPLAWVYLRLKVSPAYRASSEAALSNSLGRKQV